MKVPTGFKNNEVTLEEFVKFLQAKAKETGRKFNVRVDIRSGRAGSHTSLEVYAEKVFKTSTWYKIRTKKVYHGAEMLDPYECFVWLDVD